MNMTDLHAGFVGNPEALGIVAQFVKIDPKLPDDLAECATVLTRMHLAKPIERDNFDEFGHAWVVLESYGHNLTCSGFPNHASALLEAIKIFAQIDLMRHLDIARRMVKHAMLRKGPIDDMISVSVRSATAVTQILPNHFDKVPDERARALAKEFASDDKPTCTKALMLVKCVVESTAVTGWMLMEDAASKLKDCGQPKHSHCILSALLLFMEDDDEFITKRSRGISRCIDSLEEIIIEGDLADSAKKQRKS